MGAGANCRSMRPHLGRSVARRSTMRVCSAAITFVAWWPREPPLHGRRCPRLGWSQRETRRNLQREIAVTALISSSALRPRAPRDRSADFDLAYALGAASSAPRRLARRFEHKHGRRCAEPACSIACRESLAHDFFIGSSKASKLSARVMPHRRKLVYCRKRGASPPFMSKDARPPGSPARHAESHGREGANRRRYRGGQEARPARRGGRHSLAGVSTGDRRAPSAEAGPPPHRASSIPRPRDRQGDHGGFVETRRFHAHEFLEQPQNFSVGRPQLSRSRRRNTSGSGAPYTAERSFDIWAVCGAVDLDRGILWVQIALVQMAMDSNRGLCYKPFH